MSTKPRYRSAAAIESAIDRAHAESRRKLAEAEVKETEARAMFAVASDMWQRAAATADATEREVLNAQAAKVKNDGTMKKEEAGALMTTAYNLVEKRCRKLGAKLAEFNTLTLPGIVSDRSVEAKL